MRLPPNGWFIVEHAIKMDDLGLPLFQETPETHNSSSRGNLRFRAKKLQRAPNKRLELHRLNDSCSPAGQRWKPGRIQWIYDYYVWKKHENTFGTCYGHVNRKWLLGLLVLFSDDQVQFIDLTSLGIVVDYWMPEVGCFWICNTVGKGNPFGCPIHAGEKMVHLGMVLTCSHLGWYRCETAKFYSNSAWNHYNTS